MAGIEKVCEYSGAYVGHLMYQYKRNSIQVLPEHRGTFRGKGHRLHLFKPEKVFTDGWGFMLYNTDEMASYSPPFCSVREWELYYRSRFGMSVTNRWDYCLEVPGVMGQVGGMYYNYTIDLSTAKRKLKRILRARVLTIVEHDYSVYEFLKERGRKNDS